MVNVFLHCTVPKGELEVRGQGEPMVDRVVHHKWRVPSSPPPAFDHQSRRVKTCDVVKVRDASFTEV